MSDAVAQTGAVLHAGRFELIETLGQGAMGVVYRVRDRELGRDVALKSLDRVEPDHVYRLKREFRSAAEVLHPNLVRLHELFGDEGGCFFTMDIVEGRDLLAYVRDRLPSGASLDDAAAARLRQAFSGLVAGLGALHASGHIHRDVKPSNAIVDPATGHAVLMDFGLSVERSAGGGAEVGAFTGTFEYAAPEQAWGAEPTPAVDLYALGVTLFEVLTGELPFTGSLQEILLAKEQGRAPALDGRVPESLAALPALLARLLSPDPSRRPALSAVASVLAGEARLEAAGPARPAAGEVAPPFVGRTAELAILEGALERVGAGAPVVVEVVGEAGIGKSALVGEFVTRASTANALVLRGRCRRRESVAFRALDGIVDELSAHLLSLGAEERSRVVPDDGESLVRLFPVLARVPELVTTGPRRPVSAAEQRRRGFAAMRELLRRLSQERPVVLWIDDAQWGDGESVQLLRALLAPPAEPALLLVVSHRTEGEGALLDWLAQVVGDARSSAVVRLAALPAAECARLLEALAARGEPVDAVAAREMVREARGSPFFLGELMRLRGGSRAASGPIADLGTVVHERLAAAPDLGRRIVEMAAIAGHPLSLGAIRCLFDDTRSLRLLVDELCMRSLLRTFVRDAQEVFEPFHDCISDAIRGEVDEAVRRESHRRIARALLDSGEATPALLVGHYVAADDTAEALRQATDAAQRADEALAFEQAAELYGLAVELSPAEADRAELEWARAQALANAGDPSHAAEAFLSAAERLGRLPDEARRQAAAKGHAARQLLFAGKLAEGVRALNEAAGLLGIDVPDSPKKIARRALGLRLRYLLTRIPPPTRPAGTIDESELERLDILLGVSQGVIFLDAGLNDLLTLHYLFEAFRVGDVGHVCSAIAKEAGIEGAIGSGFWRRRADRMLDVAEALSRRADVLNRAHLAVIRGGNHWFGAEWRKCVECCETALELFEQRAGTEFETGTTWTFLLGGLAQLGDLNAVRERLEPLVRAARAATYDLITRNLYHTSEMVLVPLADDDPDEAMAACDRVMAPYLGRTFSSQHYHYLMAAIKIDLYRGDAAGAWKRISESWPLAEEAGLFAIEAIGIQLRMARATCAVAYLADAPSDAKRLAKIALGDARRIGRVRIPNAAPIAASIRGGVALTRGDRRSGIEALREALAGFETAEMALCAHATRLHLGRLGDGDASASEQWLRAQGGVRPDAFVRVLSPGFGATAPGGAPGSALEQ